jgi:Arc/MetJ family transcription regulator
MTTRLTIDDKLIEEARLLGGQKTKKAVVTAALEEYIQRRRHRRL